MYFVVIGGTGALISRCVIDAEVIAFEDLGPEAVQKLTIKEIPVTVTIDPLGNDLYKMGRDEYLKSVNSSDDEMQEHIDIVTDDNDSIL